MKAIFLALFLTSLFSHAGDPNVKTRNTTGPVVEGSPAAIPDEASPPTKLRKNKKWRKVKKPSPVNEVPPAPLPIQ